MESLIMLLALLLYHVILFSKQNNKKWSQNIIKKKFNKVIKMN